MVTQRIDENQIRECAPLCLSLDSGWGGVSRGWAWIQRRLHDAIPRFGRQDWLVYSGCRADSIIRDSAHETGARSWAIFFRRQEIVELIDRSRRA